MDVFHEMQEFGNFTPRTQRYIRRSLDIALRRNDALSLYGRDMVEQATIKAQVTLYTAIPRLRQEVPRTADITKVESFMGPLIRLTAFDLGLTQLPSFASYRFLYERLLGALARPWLPAAFCGAAALPHLTRQARRDLLQSISESAATAPGWSQREPTFYPEWVDKVEA